MSSPILPRTFCLVLLFTFCTFLSTSLVAQKVKKDLFLLIGQSNMAGRGPLEPEGRPLDEKIWMMDSTDNWVPAKDPVHFDKPAAVGVGPGLSFARAVRQALPAHEIGLIPCAVGGSGIDDWQTGARHSQTGIYPYDEMLARVKKAKKEGRIKAILWHQGEQDSNPEKAAVYEEKLLHFFTKLRKDIGARKVPVIIATLGDFYVERNPEAKRINDIIIRVPENLKNVYYVSSSGLDHHGDQVHFGTAAQKELGRRYAEKYLQIRKH